MKFSSDVMTESQIAFGGAYLGQTTTELTALLVVAKDKSKKAKPAEVATWLSAGGGVASASERLQRIAWLEGRHLFSAIPVGTETRVHPVVQ
jgi:hypothetical protein